MQCSKSNSLGLKTGVRRFFIFFHFRIMSDWGQETIKWGERSGLEGILSKSNEVMVASVATFPRDFAVSVTASLFLLWIWLPGLCCYVPGTLRSPTPAARWRVASLCQNKDVGHDLAQPTFGVCHTDIYLWAGLACLPLLSAKSGRSLQGTI